MLQLLDFLLFNYLFYDNCVPDQLKLKYDYQVLTRDYLLFNSDNTYTTSFVS